MVLTDFILAPAIPSLTARVGGIINPVVLSLSKAFDSEPYSHPRRLGAFLIQAAFQGSLITSAMFLTAMAGNPLIADLAKSVGVELTWGKWALAASVPGLISLGVIPYVLYSHMFLYKYALSLSLYVPLHILLITERWAS